MELPRTKVNVKIKSLKKDDDFIRLSLFLQFTMKKIIIAINTKWNLYVVASSVKYRID